MSWESEFKELKNERQKKEQEAESIKKLEEEYTKKKWKLRNKAQRKYSSTIKNVAKIFAESTGYPIRKHDLSKWVNLEIGYKKGKNVRFKWALKAKGYNILGLVFRVCGTSYMEGAWRYTKSIIIEPNNLTLDNLAESFLNAYKEIDKITAMNYEEYKNYDKEHMEWLKKNFITTHPRQEGHFYI